MQRYKPFLIIPILAFWYFTTFLYGKGAYEFVKAEQAFYQANPDIFVQYLSSGYLLKSEMRLNLARYVLDILKNHPEVKNSPEFNKFFAFTLNQLERESLKNLNAQMLLVQYYALINDKERVLKTMNRVLLLSPRREAVLELKKGVEIFLNGK